MMQRSYSNTITLIFIKYIDYSLPLFTFLDLTSVNFASFALASLDLASAEPRPSQEPPQRAPNDASLTTTNIVKDEITPGILKFHISDTFLSSALSPPYRIPLQS